MMPLYVYKCDQCGQVTERLHRMLYTTAFICHGDMHRVPQPVAVNWGQIKPSDGGLHPTIKRHLDDLPRKRAEFARIHEEHERRTAGE